MNTTELLTWQWSWRFQPLARRFYRASSMMPTRYLRSTLHRQPALLSLHFVALDHSVLNMDHSVGVGGDVVFVGDEDDGIAFGMKAIEQGHDFVTGLRVQVSGGLVGKNYGWTIH